jgi:tetratricopeptide (TPR) repeat protein
MKKRLFFMAIVMVLLSLSAFGQNAKKYYKAGTEFVQAMKYEEAIVQFTSAIGLAPSNPAFYYARGQAYEKQLKFKEAKADYENVIVFDPKNINALTRLGSVNNYTGNYNEALKLLDAALNLAKRAPNIFREKVISLIGLRRFDKALEVSDIAVSKQSLPIDYYYRGIIFIGLNNKKTAKTEFEKAISRDKHLIIAKLKLAELLISDDPQGALNQCNEVISFDDRNTGAYFLRSMIYRKNLDYPGAINDLSRNIMIDPSNPVFYFDRGVCYQEFTQHTNAINDFTKYISLQPDSAKAYYARARSYEEILDYEKAIADYNKITLLAEFDMMARKNLKEAQSRLYKLNEEKIPPEITVLTPLMVNDTIEIRGDKNSILISGKVKDKSKIRSFTINNENVARTEKNGESDFLANINVEGMNKITLIARDDYDNEKILNYPLKRTEIIPPKISILAPYTSEDGQVYLDTPTQNIGITGKVTDDSRIKSITVGNKLASYTPDVLNPEFTVILDISNLTRFTVIAEDIYGNKKETEFKLNREGADIAANNPMGKTWVVFIENSGYETFASLDGPIKDVGTIQRALANYQINNIIYKKDMTKVEMEKFFNIELRDLVKVNQVKSLLVWYAGHGKYINNIGYWVPVDAKRDDEFTYFNINGLRTGFQGYGDVVVHTLVISDACESGPGFYTAMRSAGVPPTCDNTAVATARSAQVFSSQGKNTELASDNSKFTVTFADALEKNLNSCIPIETIVKSVSETVEKNSGQKPKFGNISGMDDFGGTFFFMKKN